VLLLKDLKSLSFLMTLISCSACNVLNILIALSDQGQLGIINISTCLLLVTFSFIIRLLSKIPINISAALTIIVHSSKQPAQML
tara:strand:- start:143 stop:394 length:252 start_codon:yes stop_codon:yes gene_type:complete